MTIRFVSAGPISTYRVIADGIDVGEVRKWERRYNLRRTYVTKGWRARTPDGCALYTRDSYTAETRVAAAQALVDQRARTRSMERTP